MTWSEDYHVPEVFYCIVASVVKSMVISRLWPERVEDDDGLDTDGLDTVTADSALSRLQKVTIHGIHLRGSVEDLTHISTLSGMVLNYTPLHGTGYICAPVASVHNSLAAQGFSTPLII